MTDDVLCEASDVHLLEVYLGLLGEHVVGLDDTI